MQLPGPERDAARGALQFADPCSRCTCRNLYFDFLYGHQKVDNKGLPTQRVYRAMITPRSPRFSSSSRSPPLARPTSVHGCALRRDHGGIRSDRGKHPAAKRPSRTAAAAGGFAPLSAALTGPDQPVSTRRAGSPATRSCPSRSRWRERCSGRTAAPPTRRQHARSHHGRQWSHARRVR